MDFDAETDSPSAAAIEDNTPGWLRDLPTRYPDVLEAEAPVMTNQEADVRRKIAELKSRQEHVADLDKKIDSLRRAGAGHRAISPLETVRGKHIVRINGLRGAIPRLLKERTNGDLGRLAPTRQARRWPAPPGVRLTLRRLTSGRVLTKRCYSCHARMTRITNSPTGSKYSSEKSPPGTCTRG